MFVRYRRKLILLTDINPEVQEIYKNACGDYSKVELQATAVSSKMQSRSKNLPIVIYEMDEIPEATAMKGGEAISNGNGSPFSICFFGTYNGKDALIVQVNMLQGWQM
ncbi:MAG: hypothetical protein J6C84_00210 [Lachnospiraceae bacterium]|nr:hypothetical protein [Lachnospiraceae bacterium]